MDEPRKDTAQEALRKRTAKSWISERIARLFEERGFEGALETGMELIRKRRVLDFVVVAGNFGARVYGEVGPPKKIEVCLTQLTDANWQSVFSVLSKKAFYMAKLLAGELPEEITNAFSEAGCQLFPEEVKEFTFLTDGVETSELNEEFAAVIYRLCDKLVSDPFLLFTLRGRGREETILEIRKS